MALSRSGRFSVMVAIRPCTAKVSVEATWSAGRLSVRGCTTFWRALLGRLAGAEVLLAMRLSYRHRNASWECIVEVHARRFTAVHADACKPRSYESANKPSWRNTTVRASRHSGSMAVPRLSAIISSVRGIGTAPR